MKCPACSKEMTEQNFGVKVDVCNDGCKGIWFDLGELQMLDEKDEGLGAAMEAALKNPRVNDAGRGQLTCPKCSIPMQIHKYKRNKEINIDECYKCGGFFLDSGELQEIRDNFMSDQEVSAYVGQLLSEIPEYQKGLNDIEKMKKREKGIRNMTKFITVSYWKKKF